MAPTRPTPGGSSANPIDLTATRPATATMAGSGTGTSTGSGIVSGPAADSIPGTATITGMVDNPCPTPGISGISTLFNATPLTEFDLAVDRTLSQGPARALAPAAAGGILSGRVTKTKSTPKKATPNKKTSPKIPTTTTTAAAAPDSPTPGTGTGTGTSPGVDSPNPPKRGKASGLPSCLACRRSKARCDRVVACERCIKAGKECVSGEEAAAGNGGGGGGDGGEGSGGGGAGGRAGKACERCRRMKAGCVRKESCVRCEKKGQECVMA